jgi:hypothetical protein
MSSVYIRNLSIAAFTAIVFSGCGFLAASPAKGDMTQALAHLMRDETLKLADNPVFGNKALAAAVTNPAFTVAVKDYKCDKSGDDRFKCDALFKPDFIAAMPESEKTGPEWEQRKKDYEAADFQSVKVELIKLDGKWIAHEIR